MNVWIAKETERNNKYTVVLPTLQSEQLHEYTRFT